MGETIRFGKVPELEWVASTDGGPRHAYPIAPAAMALCGARFYPETLKAGGYDCGDCRGLLRLIAAGIVTEGAAA